eukprot:c20999_g1_i1.p1 GENE.c20999_g1_i1~~c20999_g1_i1.p1  ORF type:complete len:115 (+),score=7.18 c20999_g1_i1:132-476(+)
MQSRTVVFVFKNIFQFAREYLFHSFVFQIFHKSFSIINRAIGLSFADLGASKAKSHSRCNPGIVLVVGQCRLSVDFRFSIFLSEKDKARFFGLCVEMLHRIAKLPAWQISSSCE